MLPASGRHVPDAIMIYRLSECLNVDIVQLFPALNAAEERPNVLLVDDQADAGCWSCAYIAI